MNWSVKQERLALGAVLLILAAATAGIFLNGGAEQGAPGLFLTIIGLVLLLFPPQIRVEGKLWGLLAGFLFCGALGLFPARWFGLPTWRAHLQGLPIPLGPSVSPIPEETCFHLAMLAISGVLFLFMLALPLRSQSRLLVATVGVLAGLIYAGLTIYAKATGWIYAFDAESTFGFFPNRNHAASFLVTTFLLGLGVVCVGLRHGKWGQAAVAMAGLAGCGCALLVYSESRGGVIFLVVGTGLWLLGLGRRHWSKPLLISFGGVLLAVAIFFFVAKSEARNRLVKQIGQLQTVAIKASEEKMGSIDPDKNTQPEVTLDGRVFIFQDTLRMIADAPLSGIGLGAYRYIYLFYQKASLSEMTSAHPESDWLMLAVEMGLPALGIALWSVGVLLRRVRVEVGHPYWPLRWGVICAVLAALLHGLVDVPVHRVELGWWVLFFFALGTQIIPGNPLRPPLWQRSFYWLAGLGALGLGIFLIRAEWFDGPASPPRSAKQAENAIYKTYQAGNLPAAVALSTLAIARHPMSEGLYYQKAILRLQDEGTDAEADGLFAAQRALSPNWPKIPLDQGSAWLGIDPERTAVCWLDALARMRRIGQAQGRGAAGAAGLYGELLAKSRTFPQIQARLREAAGSDATMLLAWLEQVDAAMATDEIQTINADANLLATFFPAQRRAYLRIWYERGDREALFAYLEKNPTWAEAGWPVKIRRLIEAKDFATAIALVLENHRLILALPILVTDQKLPEPEMEADPLLKFDYYWKTGNTVTARRLLGEAQLATEKSGRKNPALWKKSADLAYSDQNWELTWAYLNRYLVESGLDDRL